MEMARGETLLSDESSTSSRDQSARGGAEGADEMEIGELEAEVKEMAETIQLLRRSVPGRLAEALSARLIDQRPRLPVGIGQLRDEVASEQPELNNRASPPEADQEICERLNIFRSKICGNMEVMPRILNRINGCMVKIDGVHEHGISICPVFKKR